MLSSPSGRKRHERNYDRTSVSPSPHKRVRLTPAVKFERGDDDGHTQVHEQAEDGEEDEDEEMLRLKLAAIEAKLKLKKLQAAKSKQGHGVNGSPRREGGTTDGERRSRAALRSPGTPKRAVQVPLSPVREAKSQIEPPSPARMLGIDKGLRADNVSLKRPANGVSSAAQRLASITSNPSNSSRGSPFRSLVSEDIPRPLSFSERLAANRASEKADEEKKQRIASARNRGFGLDPRPTFGVTEKSALNSDREASYQRTAAQVAALLPSGMNLPTNPSSQPIPALAPRSSAPFPWAAQAAPAKSARKTKAPATGKSKRTPKPPEEPSIDEPYTKLKLSRRILDEAKLNRALEGKELYPLPRLLKEVKSPDYEPPDCEADYVVFGIIASKSKPMEHKSGPRTRDNPRDRGQGEDEADPEANGRPKFMALTLTDFKWEVTLYLFGESFTRFWKLQPGTLIGVLNPGVMPPKKASARESGAFSLKLSDSDDTVLEIGRARDLGFCNARRPDGSECGAWLNKKKTTVCEYHISVQVEKTKRGRMEVNTMGGGNKYINSRSVGGWNEKGLKKEGRQTDLETGETMWIVPSSAGAMGTASLLDADMEIDVDRFSRGMSKEDLLKKRKKEREKEKELAQRLAIKGKGQGSEYMLRAGGNSTKKGPTPVASESDKQIEQVETTDGVRDSHLQDLLPFAFLSGVQPDGPSQSAAELGLVRTATDVNLLASKTKGRARQGANSEAIGWGGAFKRGLLLPSEKDVGQPTEAQTTQTVSEKPAKGVHGGETSATSASDPALSNRSTAQAGDAADDSDDLEII